ncbi:Uncharacterised protein [Escherichia coli]|uniref:Uncharacterized protein n=1 Tax=Escherichia coli TaxID=562 RepID=A0A376KMX8_ECOLX|nr:Uncharacterised protein [Escherichia coli]
MVDNEFPWRRLQLAGANFHVLQRQILADERVAELVNPPDYEPDERKRHQSGCPASNSARDPSSYNHAPDDARCRHRGSGFASIPGGRASRLPAPDADQNRLSLAPVLLQSPPERTELHAGRRSALGQLQNGKVVNHQLAQRLRRLIIGRVRFENQRFVVFDHLA